MSITLTSENDIGVASKTDASEKCRLKFATDGLRVENRCGRNMAETDLQVGDIRLRVLLPFALARLGQAYEVLDEISGQKKLLNEALSLRPYVRKLAKRLACGTDFIYELVNRICERGPENIRASEMLKQASDAGKDTSRLAQEVDAALIAAVEAVCVDQGLKPGTAKATNAIREKMRAAGVSGRLPCRTIIRNRSKSPRVLHAREDAYARDHLNRVAGRPDEITGLNEVVALDATWFTNEDDSVHLVDNANRDMGPANVIFGVLGSNRGIWTHLGFAGAANTYLSGLAIKRGLLSKVPLLEKYGISGVLPFHGKPSILRHDNGSEFVGAHTQRVLRDMTIAFDDKSPPRTAHYRGGIERFNRTAHVLFAEFLRSDIGRYYMTTVRGRPGVLGITLESLDRALTEWIVRDYHLRPNKGLGGDSPMSRFEKFAEGGNGLPASGLPRAMDDTPRLCWDFLWEQYRTVNQLGISFENRRYSSPQLTRLFALNRRSSQSKIPFRFNPYQMKSIFIKVPDDDGKERIIEVPWIPENERYLPTPEERQASIDPSIWEWRALYADIRKGCTAKPTRGLVEDLHQQREQEVERKNTLGRASKERVRITRNRSMRQRHANDASPSTRHDTQRGTAISRATPTIFANNRSKILDYLPVSDGADAY